MTCEQEERCAGNLREELVEMEKLISRAEEKDLNSNTHTVICGHFLTIYCC